jgi:hypothetical protein
MGKAIRRINAGEGKTAYQGHGAAGASAGRLAAEWRTMKRRGSGRGRRHLGKRGKWGALEGLRQLTHRREYCNLKRLKTRARAFRELEAVSGTDHILLPAYLSGDSSQSRPESE